MGLIFSNTNISPATTPSFSPENTCLRFDTSPQVASIDITHSYQNFPPPLPPRSLTDHHHRVVVDLHHDSSTILAFIQE